MFVLLRRKVFHLCLVTVISVLCQPVCGRITKASEKELFEISLIHINDFHARFEQVSPSTGPCLEGQEDTCVGGIARIVSVVKSLVNERPNSIFLNAGDNFQGTLWYTKFKWNVTSQFMNMLPHDALVIVSVFLIFYYRN
jgi:5'-nucleotidase